MTQCLLSSDIQELGQWDSKPNGWVTSGKCVVFYSVMKVTKETNSASPYSTENVPPNPTIQLKYESVRSSKTIKFN